MQYSNPFHLLCNPWNESLRLIDRKYNSYICVGGNTGAGKSTLLMKIGKRIYEFDKNTIAIDEKAVHHPFLPSLFHEASKYGFQIQLNFMIQRSLLVKKWLDFGYNVVMERSHLEDRIFMKHLFISGYVTKAEYSSYLDIWRCIANRLPQPDVLILLNVSAEKSIKRITNDEITGIRPEEFPNIDEKIKWITSWANLYDTFLEEMRGKETNTQVIILNGTANSDEIIKKTVDFVVRKTQSSL